MKVIFSLPALFCLAEHRNYIVLIFMSKLKESAIYLMSRIFVRVSVLVIRYKPSPKCFCLLPYILSIVLDTNGILFRRIPNACTRSAPT